MGIRKRGGAYRRYDLQSGHPLEDEPDGGVADRSRFTIDKVILGDDDVHEEYYIQIIISRKAAAILVAFFTVLVSLVEAGTRYFVE